MISVEPITLLRDDFRQAFQAYLKEGDRMAELLRAADDQIPAGRGMAVREQQMLLTAALQKYESARRKYVEAVMGQLSGLSAMGLPIQ